MLANAGAALRRVGMGLGKEGGGRLPGTMSAALRPGAGQKNLIELGLEGAPRLRAVSTRAKGLRDLSGLAFRPVESASALLSLRSGTGGAGSTVFTAMSGSSPSLRLLRRPLTVQMASFSSSAAGSGGSKKTDLGVRLELLKEAFPFKTIEMQPKSDLQKMNKKELSLHRDNVLEALPLLKEGLCSGHDCVNQSLIVLNTMNALFAECRNQGIDGIFPYNSFFDLVQELVTKIPSKEPESQVEAVAIFRCFLPLLSTTVRERCFDEQFALLMTLFPVLDASLKNDPERNYALFEVMVGSARFFVWSLSRPQSVSQDQLHSFLSSCLDTMADISSSKSGVNKDEWQVVHTIFSKFLRCLDFGASDNASLLRSLDAIKEAVPRLLSDFEEDHLDVPTTLGRSGLWSWLFREKYPAMELKLLGPVMPSRNEFFQRYGLFSDHSSTEGQLLRLYECSQSVNLKFPNDESRRVYAYSVYDLLCRTVLEGCDLKSMAYLSSVISYADAVMVSSLVTEEQELLTQSKRLFLSLVDGNPNAADLINPWVNALRSALNEPAKDTRAYVSLFFPHIPVAGIYHTLYLGEDFLDSLRAQVRK